jgi:hypothetical protein
MLMAYPEGLLMKKLVTAALLGMLVLGLAGPATAVPPEIHHFKWVNETETIPAGELCEFPVVVSSTGTFREAVYFNQDGSERRLVSNPSLVTTYSNPLSGTSFSSPDRGMDRVTFNPDGTVTVFGTGIHLRVKGEIQQIGLWILTFDEATGELLSAEYHGNFDGGVEEGGAYICAKLA